MKHRTKLICEHCGIEAPTRFVRFRYVIGMFHHHEEETLEEHVCKRCLHRIHWQFNLTNLFYGWWGYTLFVTPILLVLNGITYMCGLTMPGVPIDAKEPEVRGAEIERLEKVAADLVAGIETGDDPDWLAEQLALRADVTPAQVIVYLNWLIDSGNFANHSKRNDPEQKPWW